MGKRIWSSKPLPNIHSPYESSPEKIPLKSAWQLADRFNVSIDAIVGREHVDVSSLRGEVQDAYDALSEQSQASMRDYLAFLAQRDARDAGRREAEERRRLDALCYRLEQAFLSKLGEEDPDLFVFGSGERVRAAFEAYLAERAAESGQPDAQASVEQLMAAYDRAHDTMDVDGWHVDYSVTDLRNPGIRAAFEDARKGVAGR